ncbi:MAG: S8 family serine peptidase [Gammaproteobacteria bacterium]|nr:S8 family serine peptidase [Gammaproteobacteria bacterium]
MKLSTLTTAIRLTTVAAAMTLPLATQAAEESARYIVKYRAGAAESVAAAARAQGGGVAERVFGTDAIAITVPASALKGLKNNPNIEYIELDVKRYPLSLTTPSTGTPYQLGQQVPYGVKMVQADQLPQLDSLASNRKVCIIDSGYDNAHEDLAGNNVNGEYDSGTGWWYTDENHHGTHVAGTIAAINNGTGVVGVNANKKLNLHIVKVFSADGWAYSSSLSSAANKCAAAGAKVISMSLGGGRKSRTEENTFKSLSSKGILSIAAAGNDGNTTLSYPASYSIVMSVAAVDENKAWASFSQYNSAVDIAAPGVAVLSSVPMGTGSESALSVGSATYTPGDMDGSPKTTATAPLADFGIGDAVNSAVAGKVCLIARGTVDFATKVKNCESSGGVGAVVYNNVAGAFGGTMNGTVTNIPSVTATDVDGAAMKAQLGQNATVAVKATNYAYFDGTSMATPHVSAVAALVWSYFPTCTNLQIRAALEKTAEDLTAYGTGRDNKTGYGLVRAKAAYDYLSRSCNG